MSLLNSIESIKNEINSILKKDFNDDFIVKDISNSHINNEYVNIFDDCCSSMGYDKDSVKTVKLCFVMNMKHNNLPIKTTIYYFEDNFEIKFNVPEEAPTSILDDCKKVEDLLQNKKVLWDCLIKCVSQKYLG